MFESKDLSHLKAGDEAYIVHNYYGNIDMKLAKVEKVTPSGLLKVNGNLYKPDGSRRGDPYCGYEIEGRTPEADARAEALGLKDDTVKSLMRVMKSSAASKVRTHGTGADVLRSIKEKADALADELEGNGLL